MHCLNDILRILVQYSCNMEGRVCCCELEPPTDSIHATVNPEIEQICLNGFIFIIPFTQLKHAQSTKDVLNLVQEVFEKIATPGNSIPMNRCSTGYIYQVLDLRIRFVQFLNPSLGMKTDRRFLSHLNIPYASIPKFIQIHTKTQLDGVARQEVQSTNDLGSMGISGSCAI